MTNSPIVGTNTKTKAAMTPGMLSGNVTRQNVRHRLAPRSLAASSRELSRLSSETKIGSATNGTQTYARTRITENWLLEATSRGGPGSADGARTGRS